MSDCCDVPRTILLVLLLRLLNPHISLPFSNLYCIVLLYCILKSLHWLKVNERIKYKLIFLTYKVLTCSQPSCLNNLISVQPPRSTRSSAVVTLSRPPTISSLKSQIGHSDTPMHQLPNSFGQPRQSRLDSLPHSLVSSSLSALSSSPLSSSITRSLQAQNLPFQQTLPTFYSGPPSRSRDRTGLIMLLELFLFRFYSIILFVRCGGLSWLQGSFLLHVKYIISYRIVSYRIVVSCCSCSRQCCSPSSSSSPMSLLTW